MDENSKGGFDKTFDGASGTAITDSKGNTRVSGGSVPSGDIRIHSHPVGTTFDEKTGKTLCYLADEPTDCKNNVGDLCGDLNYKLNIIVGKNGLAPESEKIQGKWVQSQDNRNYSINVFDSNNRTAPKFTVLAVDANSIIQDEKSRSSAKKVR